MSQQRKYILDIDGTGDKVVHKGYKMDKIFFDYATFYWDIGTQIHL